MPADAVPVSSGGAGPRVRHADAAGNDAGVPGRSGVRLPRPPVHARGFNDGGPGVLRGGRRAVLPAGRALDAPVAQR